MSSKQAPVDIAKLLLDLLAESGISRGQLLALAEIQNIQITGNEPNAVTLPILLPAAIKISDNPALALELGQRIQVTNFGTVSFALMSCLNLREVLNLLIRYHPIVNLGPAWELCEYPGGIALRSGPVMGNSEVQRLLLELMFSGIVSMGESLLNRRIGEGELHLNFPSPRHTKTYSKFFPMPVKFNQANCQIILTEQDLNSRLPNANPAGHVIFQQQCEELLRGLNRVENVSAAVRRLLIKTGREFPNINQVAEHLHISERTLRRRLNQESTNFRMICDEVRSILACRYLMSTDFTVAEVADLLGYSETVSFRRAFIRWNKQTPNTYRLNANR
jgi:AraC-like DNA-binding protein